MYPSSIFYILGNVVKSYTQDCINFVKKLLCKSVKERLSAKKALKHPWMVNGTNNIVEEETKGKIINRLQNFKVPDLWI